MRIRVKTERYKKAVQENHAKLYCDCHGDGSVHEHPKLCINCGKMKALKGSDYCSLHTPSSPGHKESYTSRDSMLYTIDHLQGLVRRLEKSNEELGLENHRLKRSIEWCIRTGAGDRKELTLLPPKGWD